MHLMTEVQKPVAEGAEYKSPSTRGKEDYLLFSTNPPPLDLQREGPSEKDLDRAKLIEGELGGEEGKVSIPVVIGLGVGGTTLLTVGGVGGYFIHDAFASEKLSSVPGGTSFGDNGLVFNNPDSGPQSVAAAETRKVKPDEVFDSGAITGVITPAMKKIVFEEDLQELNSFARLTNKTEIVTAQKLIEEMNQMLPPEERKMYLMYPEAALNVSFEVGDDKNTIEILSPLDLSQTSKKDAEIKYVKSFGGGSIGGDVGEDLFKDKGYFDKIEFRMADGSRIPKGSVIDMFVANEDGGYLLEIREGVGDRVGKTGLLIDLQAPNGNIYRFLVMALKGEGLNTKIVSLEPLVPAPEFSPEFNTKPVGTYGYNVVAGQSILQLSEDADRVEIVLLVSHKGNRGEISRSRPGSSPFVVTNLEMFVSDGKVIAAEPLSPNTLGAIQKDQ